MPIEKHHHAPQDIEAPKEPHLALFTNEDGAPIFKGLPRGAVLAVVTDPRDPVRGIIPMAIVRVGPKRLEFQCPCGAGNCTRRYVFNVTVSGIHPRNQPLTINTTS